MNKQNADELILYANNAYVLFFLILLSLAPFFYLITIGQYLIGFLVITIPVLLLTINPLRNITHYMKLTREGFEVYWLGIRWIYYWEEVSEFRPYINISVRSEPVMFQFSPNAYCDSKRSFTPSTDFTTISASLYGVGCVELCDLLNLWRRRSLER